MEDFEQYMRQKIIGEMTMEEIYEFIPAEEFWASIFAEKIWESLPKETRLELLADDARIKGVSVKKLEALIKKRKWNAPNY